MSVPRYWVRCRPLETSILPTSISSRRVTRERGTAFGSAPPARKTSIEMSFSWSPRLASASAAASLRASCRPVPTAETMPFGSMIMITDPSPRMVLPENIVMWRSFELIGLTTISSVWKTPSTTMPKVWLPTWVTTMKVLSAFSVRLAPSSILQELLEVNERKELVAQAQDRRVVDVLDAVLGVRLRAHELDHGELRNREAVLGAFDDQGRDDGQGERDLDGEGRALARRRLEVDRAADRIDVGAHDVHADAAARRRW